MTGNQIAYWRNLIDQQNYLENQRLGWARYNEQVRSDQAQEAIGWGNLNENIRHNKVNESETHRHNVVTENYNYDVLRETIRNHGVMESIAAQNAATQRFAAESNYRVGMENVATQRLVAQNNYRLGRANLKYQYANLSEVERHNKETEDQNNRQILYNRWIQEDRLALDRDANEYNQTVGTIKSASDIVSSGIRTVASLFK